MIKLSICMMVKNEEKNLKRCLDSVKELMEAVESEIIIVDTGSTDGTVSIASKYTNNIYHHIWNNNFSEMRNISIAYASGEFVFILDADEVLVNSGPIIDFLNTSHHENVVGAAIFLKNAKNHEGTDFGAELITPRIFRKRSGIRYEGIVHNMPIVSGRLLEVGSVLHHFGYIHNDEELMEKKFIRTKNLIEEALKNDPNNIYYNFQLSVTYDMHKDVRESYNQIQKTYELITSLGYSLMDYLYIYSSYAKVALSLEYYDEVIQICNEGLNLNSEYLDLFFFRAGANLRLGKSEQGLNDYKNYLSLVDSFHNLGIRQNSSIQHYTLNMKQEAYCNSCIVSFQLNDFDYSLKCAKEVVNRENEKSNYYQAVFDVYLKLLIMSSNYEALEEWFNRLQLEEYKDIILSKLLIKLMTNDSVEFLLESVLKIEQIEFLNEKEMYDNVNIGSSILWDNLRSSYYLYMSLLKCKYDVFINVEDKVSKKNKEIVLSYFVNGHLPNQEYEDFYDKLKNDDSVIGFHFHVLYCSLYSNFEKLTLSDILMTELFSLRENYYRITLTLLLGNKYFIDYMSHKISDNNINVLLIELANNEELLHTHLANAIKNYDDEYIQKHRWERVFRYFLKTALTIEGNQLNWLYYDRYNHFLHHHLINKYQELYVLNEMIENFTNNEEAYGIALIRSGYFAHITEPKWLLTASELLPMTARYLSIKLSIFNQELEENDPLVLELKEEIMKLYNNGNRESAMVILNEGLKLRPNSVILSNLLSSFENQLN